MLHGAVGCFFHQGIRSAILIPYKTPDHQPDKRPNKTVQKHVISVSGAWPKSAFSEDDFDLWPHKL
jgi:hypothetical protein